MFKKICGLVIALGLVAVPALQVSAMSLIATEKQYYTVQLRSDEKTLNYVKIIFENSSSSDELKSYTFSAPNGLKISNVGVQQVLAKPKDGSICKTYETIDQWRDRQTYFYNNYSATQIQQEYERGKKCLEYETTGEYDEDFDYDGNMSSTYDYYYYSYYQRPDAKFNYSDLTIQENGSDYTVELEKPVKPKKQAAILVSFVGDGVISNFLGYYSYEYKTLVSKQMVSKATVAINFDEGMYSREAKQKRTVETSGSSEYGIKSGVSADANYQSDSTDDIWGSIGQGGTYVKTQSNLMPGDVMRVRGVFAESPWQLFLKEIAITGLVLAVLAIGSVIGYRWYRKNHPKVEKKMLEKSVSTFSNPGSMLVDPGTVSHGRAVTVTLVSLVIFGVTTLLIGSMVALITRSNIGSYIVVILGIVLGLYTLVILPIAYIFNRDRRAIFKWALTQSVGLLTLLLIVVLIVMLTSGSTSNGYVDGPMYNN